MSALPRTVSQTFDPQAWRDVAGFEDLTDLTYHRGVARTADGERDLPVVRVAFDRPEVRNAFRPHTVDELYRVLDHARMTSDVGTVLITGNGPSPRTAAGRSAPAATNASAAAPATSTRPPRTAAGRSPPSTPSTPPGQDACTSSRSSASSAPCQRS